MITQILKFLRVLGSEASPMQISMAISLAMIVGFTPLLSPHNFLIIFVLMSFRINLAAFLLSLALFSSIAYLLDPAFHTLGMSLLQAESLQATWVTMYNTMFWRVAGFNNSIFIGSLAVSLSAFIPALLILNILIRQYRDHFLVFLKKSKVARFVQNSKLLTRISSMMES